jgi:hypothetical protein
VHFALCIRANDLVNRRGCISPPDGSSSCDPTRRGESKVSTRDASCRRSRRSLTRFCATDRSIESIVRGNVAAFPVFLSINIPLSRTIATSRCHAGRKGEVFLASLGHPPSPTWVATTRPECSCVRNALKKRIDDASLQHPGGLISDRSTGTLAAICEISRGG